MDDLITLGQSTPNILTDPTQTYGTDFNLDAWATLTTQLGLTDTKQTYLIWLWLTTAYDQTYNRAAVAGSNAQTGLVGDLAANTLRDTMTTMRLELPMFTLASQFNISYAQNVTASSQTCSSFYTDIFKWPTTQVTSLCNDVTNTFNFKNDPTNNMGYFKTAVALTSVYLYGSKFDTANAGYYSLFMALTGWNDI
jgi:hypothetical protein